MELGELKTGMKHENTYIVFINNLLFCMYIIHVHVLYSSKDVKARLKIKGPGKGLFDSSFVVIG